MHQRPGGPVVWRAPCRAADDRGRCRPPVPPRRRRPPRRGAVRRPGDRARRPDRDPLDLPLDDPAPPPDRRRRRRTRAGRGRSSGTDPAADAAEPEDGRRPISGVGITLLVTDLARSLELLPRLSASTEVDRGAGNAVLASGSDPPGAAGGHRGGADQPPAGARQPGGRRHRGRVRAAARTPASASRTPRGWSTGARSWRSGRRRSATRTATASPSPSGGTAPTPDQAEPGAVDARPVSRG